MSIRFAFTVGVAVSNKNLCKVSILRLREGKGLLWMTSLDLFIGPPSSGFYLLTCIRDPRLQKCTTLLPGAECCQTLHLNTSHRILRRRDLCVRASANVSQSITVLMITLVRLKARAWKQKV